MHQEQDVFLEALYQEHFQELELYAYAMVRDRGHAQSAVQEAFHIACQKIDDVMTSPNPMGWMKLAVKNVCRNMNKRRSQEMKLVLSVEDLYVEPAEPRRMESEFELMEACRQLVSPEEFEMVKSVVLDGVSYAELAERRGLSMWACYKRVERVLKKLRDGMQEK